MENDNHTTYITSTGSDRFRRVRYGTIRYGNGKKQARGSLKHGRVQYGTVRNRPASHNLGKSDPKKRIKGPRHKLELDQVIYVRIGMIREKSRWKDLKIQNFLNIRNNRRREKWKKKVRI